MAAKKRMQVVVDEVITGPCPDCHIHAGVMARQEAICAKMEEGDSRINEKMEDRDKLIGLRFESMKESIGVAKETMDARLSGMNQLTHQLDLQRQETKEKMLELTNTFLPKERFDAEHKTFSITLNSKIDAITSGIASKFDGVGKDISSIEIREAARQKQIEINTGRLTVLETAIGPIQHSVATRKEGLRWVEYVITVIVSFVVFVMARLVLKF